MGKVAKEVKTKQKMKPIKAVKPKKNDVKEVKTKKGAKKKPQQSALIKELENDLAKAKAKKDEEDEIQEETYSDAESGSEDDVQLHKEALERLQTTDPEFYKFLKENDKKLLEFNLSDDEDSKDEDDDTEQVHKPPTELEEASDEDDFDPDDETEATTFTRDSRSITLKMIKQWQSDIQADKPKKAITDVILAFNAALRHVSGDEKSDNASTYIVEGSAVFNAIIQICVLELGPAIRRFLGITGNAKMAPHKCKKFPKIKNLLKDYFSDLLKLLGGVSSTNILNVLLKHLHYMAPLLVSYLQIGKHIMRRLITLWSTADESVRVVAFLCILRITHHQQQTYLDKVLKAMYMGYVKNSKFVSANTLPGINFMRRSLVEIYSLDLNFSYPHVFLYIRQLAINLRNAIVNKKGETVQAVYNWQFINSLKLWGNLLAVNCHKPQMQPLIYPFVQVCIGTLKLIPSPQYYPLRFHVLQILIDLSKDTGVFIPIIPFFLEVLTDFDFNKKHTKVSMKPLNFMCILRLSKSQMQENGFKDATIDMIYGQLLEYLSSQSQSIAFPDLVLTCRLQVKAFMKKCRNSVYQRKMAQLLEKVEANSTFIDAARKKTAFVLSDFKAINAWEAKLKVKGTPLTQFFDNWDKVRKVKKSREVSKVNEFDDYNLPKIKKSRRKQVSDDEDDEVELFPSDDDEEQTLLDKPVEKPAEKPKREKRGKKLAKKSNEVDFTKPIDDKETDVVEDLDMNDW